MQIKSAQKFSSKQSGNVIKVTKITRSAAGHIYDRCLVGDTKMGRVIQGTQRVVYADSIRRRYSKV